ncbi:MAG TPA: protein-disulfide reductase DsbD [Spongiibacteraceae bacterium]|nr:protein-disulfide reductase DsbD [Spongiibacteraceae bacterium]
MLNRRLPLLLSLLLCALLSQLCVAAGDPFKSAGRNSDLVAHDEFLPVDQAYKSSVDFQSGKLAVHWQIAEGYYLYRHQFAFTADGQALDAVIPAGKAKEDEFFGHVEVYYHGIDVILATLPTQPFTLAITSQGCADAGLCYPPATRYFRIDPATQTAAATAAPLTNVHSATTSPTSANADTSIGAWLTILLLAALGGATLNLMPCVFPVLSLKVLSFANHRDQRQTLHGLSYMAGVIGSFLLVAGLLLGLKAAGRAVGWGFQLQEPWFVGALAYLFFAMGLSLSGFWALGGSWMGLGGKLAEQPGYSGSFFTGVLATLVASPCTAPFMSSALGFAVTQPALPALSVFAALGFGMALPVLLLCLNPKLLARIPKPGAWMVRFKQVLAFPLYATAIWLCWIVGRQTGASGMALILGGALLLTLGLWLWQFGIFSRLVAALSFALAIGGLSDSLLKAASGAPGDIAAETQPYSAATLASLRAAGKPVFLNVTADWCITCLTNEKIALSSRAVKEAFASRGITYLKGDWTNYDPVLTALLSQFGRSGIPLYVFFPADAQAAPIVLPQLLTPSAVVDALTPPAAPVAAAGR